MNNSVYQPVKVPKDTLDNLKNIQASIPLVKADIERGKRAGLDMTTHEKDLQALEKQLKSFLDEYGKDSLK